MFLSLIAVLYATSGEVSASRRGRPLGTFAMDDKVMKEEMIKLEKAASRATAREDIQITSIQSIMKEASGEVEQLKMNMYN